MDGCVHSAVKLAICPRNRPAETGLLLEGRRLCSDVGKRDRGKDAFFTERSSAKICLDYSGSGGPGQACVSAGAACSPELSGGPREGAGRFLYLRQAKRGGAGGRSTPREHLYSARNFAGTRRISARCQNRRGIRHERRRESAADAIYITRRCFAPRWALRCEFCFDNRKFAPGGFFAAKSSGRLPFASTPSDGAKKVTGSPFSGSIIAVVGSNGFGSGISPKVMSACTLPVTIPMRRRAESLNAAAARRSA